MNVENKRIRVGILSLPFHFGPFGFSALVYNVVLGGDRVLVQSLNIAGVGVGIDVFEGPESRVTSSRSFVVFI